jgi:ABC-2 type transport system permease protein
MVYAGLMSGMGTLIPGTREASQVSILVSLPLILPLFLITALARSPNGWLSMGLSLFPLTAPIAMIMRLSIADVPLWQILLSAALLLVTGILVLRFTSGFFRAQNLLSGQKFHLKTFLRALIGKA